MLDCLVREAKAEEESERARDGRPQAEVHNRHALRVRTPDDSRVLVDAAEVGVQVREAAPRVEVLLVVVDDVVRGEGDGEQDVERGEAHEPEVAVAGEVLVGSHELAEPLATLEERFERHDTVHS